MTVSAAFRLRANTNSEPRSLARARLRFVTRLFATCAALLIAWTAAPWAASRATYVAYEDVRDILGAMSDILPADLRAPAPGTAEASWTAWATQHDREIRDRLASGDEDTIVNWLLLGSSFTRRPRAFVDLPANQSGALQQLSELIAARAHDLATALGAVGSDERRAFARDFFERGGFRLENPADRERLEQHLLAAVVRVGSEQARYSRELEDARASTDQTEAFAARSKLFRQRGLSLDTSIQPSFSLEQSLRELRRRRLISEGSVRDVAVIGPGLDFSDKGSGYDFYPQQTLQPFALVDSLVRLGLADRGESVRLTTLDLSPRVNAHLMRTRQRALRGSAYVLRLPLDGTVSWTPEFLAYWNAVGDRIGTAGETVSGTDAIPNLRLRTIRVRPPIVSKLQVEDLDVVVQRLADRRFDLVVATNVFVYYDVFDQALALSNVASMIRPGGFLLSNNAIIELPSSHLRSVGYLTTVYSNRRDDGDHMVWYQRSIR